MWSDACAQFVVHNNGALLTIKTGCVATIKSGDLINNVGTIDNAGALTVEGDVVNNDMVTGGGLNTGSFTLSGNWENNQTFTANQSRVILNGGNQDITGTAISSFYNLRLTW
jgi:formylmethanofuran dehydrogenase subunit C